MRILKKYKILFFIGGVLIYFSISIYFSYKRGDDRKAFFEKFDLKFEGVVYSANYELGHGETRFEVKVCESNKRVFKDKGDIWYYCRLENDTAYMQLSLGDCIKVGDSIFIGPGKRIVVKNLNDTVLDSPNGKNDCYRRELK